MLTVTAFLELQKETKAPTVDDINPALPLRTLSYGNYGIFLTMGNAGFIASTAAQTLGSRSLMFQNPGIKPI